MEKQKITDFDRGYWVAVQNVLALDYRPDRQTAKKLIIDAGFTRDTCLTLLEESDFNADILREIVDQIYPEKKQ